MLERNLEDAELLEEEALAEAKFPCEENEKLHVRVCGLEVTNWGCFAGSASSRSY